MQGVLLTFLSSFQRVTSTIASFIIPRQITKAVGIIDASGLFVEIAGID